MPRLPRPLLSVPLVRLVCLLWLTLGLSGGAAAADLATLERLSAVDMAGRWRVVEETGEVLVVAGEVRTPTRRGQTLPVGVVIETRQGRAELRFTNGHQLNIAEGSRVTLTSEQSVLQELGEVYYRVRGAFRVQFATVETVVEGTRFLVVGEGEDRVTVRVEEGVVRVTNAAGTTRLTPGQQVAMPKAGPAAPAEAWPKSPGRFTKTWPTGRPRLELTGIGEAGFVGEAAVSSGAALGLRVGAGLGLGRSLRLSYEAALSGLLGDGLRAPQSLGLELQLGQTGLRLGGLFDVTYESHPYACGGDYAALHLGGSARLRHGLELSRRLSLLSELRGGYADALSLSAGVGLGVGL